MSEQSKIRKSRGNSSCGQNNKNHLIPETILLSLVISIAFVLSACTSSSPTASPVGPTSTRTPPALGPTSTQSEALPTETSAPPPPTAQPIPPVSSGDWRRGPENAEVTIFVYSDFQ
jgi:hypothetical protein